MYFIDTHTHLYLDEFKNDINKVIENAINNGVQKMFLPNINSKTTSSMIDLCKQYPENCFAMIGLHPCEVKKESLYDELDHIENRLAKHNFIGIGEIGIDLHWDKTTLEIQKEAFIKQIKIAKTHQLPIVIHVRNSFNETIEIVENLNDENLKGVFHCFTGNIQEAERIINLGNFYLGIGGVLTFKNSGLDKTIKIINLNNIMLETDSPYLSPTPLRGKRNESKNIVNIAQKLAEIKNISLEEVSEITTRNATDLFKIS